eukprot:1182032-Prorocentrum_minimum.AAC.1
MEIERLRADLRAAQAEAAERTSQAEVNSPPCSVVTNQGTVAAKTMHIHMCYTHIHTGVLRLGSTLTVIGTLGPVN